MGDLISVIVPIYKVENYLKVCVQSILDQSYGKLEVILVDDGSPDNCGKMCDDYAIKDSRVKVIHKANGGLSDARNAGICAAHGEYITFVDSDDFLDENMIEYLYTAIRKNNVDIACCQRQEINECGKLLKSKRKYNTFVINGNEECMHEFLSNPQMDTVAWGKLYVTSMFDDIRYPVGRYNEDVFTTYKLISKCKSIFVGENKYYYYRIRTNSIMTTTFNRKHLDAIDGNEERAAFIKDNYPKLQKLANAGILYAVNQCVMRMISSSNDSLVKNLDVINKLQKYYRKYEWSFICGPSGIKAKIFSLLCYFNLRAVVFLMKKIRG